MVDIELTGVRYSLSERLKAYIQDKLGALKRFHPGLTHVHVTIRQDPHHGYRVDAEMHLPHGKDIIAHDSEETVYSAVDVVTDKCAAQLRKVHSKEHKPKRSDRLRVNI